MSTGHEIARAERAGETPAWTVRMQYSIARVFVLNSVRRALGLDRCRLLFALDAELPADDVRWFGALGVPLVRFAGSPQAPGIAVPDAVATHEPQIRPLLT
jgi:long-chain acyl-CoA synthetase